MVDTPSTTTEEAIPDIESQQAPLTLQARCDAGDATACAQLQPVESEEALVLSDEEMNAALNQDEVVAEEVQPEEVVVEEVQPMTDEEMNASINQEPSTKAVLTDEDMNAIVNQEVGGEEPSISRKIGYGADIEPNIIGSLSRLVETGYETAFEGKDWEQARKDTEQERLNVVYQAYPEFVSGKYDSDGSVLAGRISTALIDPVTFLMPWTKAVKAGQILKTATIGEKTTKLSKVTGAVVSKTPLMALGAGVSGGEYALHEYARNGEVDTDMLLFVMGAGGLLTVAVEPFAKKLIAGYNNKFGKTLTAADINKATSPEEVKKILGTRNVDKLTPDQIKVIDEVFELPHLRDLNDLVKQATNNVRRLGDLRSARNEVGKLLKKGSITKRVAKNRNLKLTQQFDDSISNMIDKRSNAIIEITEHLFQNRSLTAKTFEVATRPIVGSLMMGGAGVMSGQDDDTIKMMMLSGLLLGHAQKRIQNSTFIPQELKKEVVTNIFKRQWEIQKRNIKIITAGTHVTKLKAMGEETGLFADLMHHTFSPKGTRQLSVEERASMASQFWNIVLHRDVLKGATQAEQQSAIKTIRGFATKKEQTKEVKELSIRIKSFLNKYKSYHEEVNIKAKDDLDNYFPREFNFEAMDAEKLMLPISHPAYKDFNGLSMMDVVKGIIKKQNPKMKAKAVETKASDYMLSLRSFDADNIMEAISKTGATKFKVHKLPLIKHLEQSRELHGTIKIKGKVIQVEELINPWLKKDATEVLSNMIKESSKTVEFARTFGSKGEILQNILRRINKKYEGTAGDTKLHHKHQKELRRVTDGVDAFFGRYGAKRYRSENNVAAWFSLYNASLMLEDVTLANLGDLVQPFQNSHSLKSVWKGLKLTSGTAKRTATRDDIEPASVIAILESDVLAIDARASAGMGDAGGVVRNLSDSFYKATGLHKITSFARRFAFNSGTQDAFTVSKEWATLRQNLIRQVERENSVKWARLSQKKKIELFKGTSLNNSAYREINLKLNYFGIDDVQAKAIAQFDDFGSAYANKDLRSIFHMAGFRAMERDSKIPNVGNRLLFTQSRNPYTRLMGQFSSWAQAKTAQTNSLIKRIESGDGKLMIKMIGALTIYTGIRELRDIVKEGTLDTKTHTFAETVTRANDLSGNPGIWAGYMTQILKASKLQNTGYNPMTMFPTGSTAMEAIKQISAEDPDFNRLIPLPKMRKLIQTLIDEGEIPRNVTLPGMSVPEYAIPQYSKGGLVEQSERLGFNKGGLGTATGQTTEFNKPVLETGDGKYQSEVSVTVEFDGGYVNAASLQKDINPDRLLTDDEVINGLLDGSIKHTGVVYKNVDDAVSAAQERSNSIDVENKYYRRVTEGTKTTGD